jgi:hypothetical protein
VPGRRRLRRVCVPTGARLGFVAISAVYLGFVRWKLRLKSR